MSKILGAVGTLFVIGFLAVIGLIWLVIVLVLFAFVKAEGVRIKQERKKRGNE